VLDALRCPWGRSSVGRGRAVWATLGYLSPQYGVPDRDAVVAPVRSTSQGSGGQWPWHASSLPVSSAFESVAMTR
jgi:hypothetical protein